MSGDKLALNFSGDTVWADATITARALPFLFWVYSLAVAPFSILRGVRPAELTHTESESNFKGFPEGPDKRVIHVVLIMAVGYRLGNGPDVLSALFGR